MDGVGCWAYEQSPKSRIACLRTAYRQYFLDLQNDRHHFRNNIGHRQYDERFFGFYRFSRQHGCYGRHLELELLHESIDFVETLEFGVAHVERLRCSSRLKCHTSYEAGNGFRDIHLVFAVYAKEFAQLNNAKNDRPFRAIQPYCAH